MRCPGDIQGREVTREVRYSQLGLEVKIVRNEQAESLEMGMGEEAVCGGGKGASSPDALRVHALTSPHPFTPNITVRVKKKKMSLPKTKSLKLMKTMLKRQPLNINNK